MHWELVAVNLSMAGFSWGCSREIDSAGREIFTVDAYASDGRQFIVLASERLAAFLELCRQTSQRHENGGYLGLPAEELEAQASAATRS